MHKGSSYSTKSELNLFTIPPTRDSIEQGITVEYKCKIPLAGKGPLEFFIDRNDDYTGLSEPYLYLKA